MKLFHINFEEILRTQIEDEDGTNRTFEFEDSEMYSYFADYEFLCVLFQEPEEYWQEVDGQLINLSAKSLSSNRFVGFKRLVFSDEFLYGPVKRLWEDTRDKIINNKLVDVQYTDKNGNVIINKSGGISSAPNFMKSKENTVFLRGSGTDSSMEHKTECVNDIHMLPQYVWIKGSAVVEELNSLKEL